MDATTMQLFIRFSIVVLILLVIDFYVFQGVKTLTRDLNHARLIQYGYWILNLTLIVLLLSLFLLIPRRTGINIWVSRGMIGLFLIVNIPKLVFVVFLLGEDVVRLSFVSIKYLASFFQTNAAPAHLPDRRKFISTAAVLVAAIPFAAIIHGIWKGRYNFTLRKVNLEFAHLPEAFDGFTITQLSDIHIGSFDNVEAVERGIKMANDAKSDLFLFTGDLVNNLASEMDNWISVIGKLEAPFGKFSVFGNHDYGDYVPWDSAEQKQNNLLQLKKVHQQIGMDLLCNENRTITKNGQTITLVGVENWGLPPFPQHGNLDLATQNLHPDGFKILMSHDPSHWDAVAKKHESNPALTLAGHTHGMQFGIEIPGFKWSPVKFKYPKWAGLYEDGGKYLYVNRGFGFLAFPGRVGIWPEVTQFTLRRKK